MIRRNRKRRLNRKGITLEELMLCLAVTSNLMSFMLPAVSGMVKNAQLTKAEKELITLKSAVAAYWRNNTYRYPENIHAALVARSNIVGETMRDPFQTDTINGTYGYVQGRDARWGDYFFIYTKGPSRSPTFPSWDSVNGRVLFDGNGLVVSNVDCHRE